MDPNKKRKRGDPEAASAAVAPEDDNKRPRVRAQRKFAQGQTSLLGGSPSVKISQKSSRVGGCSSGSSTASGPALSTSSKKGKCPKTEDFLTFLCLRGTNLLPPELDHFNRANLPESRNVSSDDDVSSDNGKEKTPKRGGIITPIAPGAVRKSASNNMVLKKHQSKNLPPSVRALKKKYVERRLARSVVTKSLRPATSVPGKSSSTSAKPGTREGVRTRSANKLKARRQSRPLTDVTKASSIKVQSTTRKPSAAAIIAKRKTRMATLTAASSRVSRMLTRLTPRGTSSAAFVKKTRALQLSSHKSLRGRDISVSSDEADEEMDADKGHHKKKGKPVQSGSTGPKKNTPPKRKLKSRKPCDAIERKGSEADEETSSRDSSRPPSQLPPPKQQSKKATEGKVSSKGDNRSSTSRERSDSKDSGKSSERPTRKTKEAATVYLNMLGQNLTSKKDDDDTISIDSLSESTQGKRLEELGIDLQKKNSGKKYIVTPSIKKTDKSSSREGSKGAPPDTDDTKSDVDSEKSRERKKKSSKREGEKKKGKQTLKELQDRLLEEAKKKMGGSNPDSPQPRSMAGAKGKADGGDSDTADSDERITISQRTGYIQVKPRRSIDQMGHEEQQQVLQGGSIGANGRRLSKNGERTSTPPRKILPKSSDHIERTSGSPHLPVGVMGAALSSTRLTSSPMGSSVSLKSATVVSGQMQGMPMISGPVQMNLNPQNLLTNPNGNQHGGIPLTQPLVINTSFASGPLTNAQTVTMTAPVQFTTAQGGIIVSNTGVRMPISMGPNIPVQVRTSGGIPIMMPHIALPSGSIIQSMPAGIRPQPQQAQNQQASMAMCTATVMRSNYTYAPQSMTTSQVPVSMMQQQLLSTTSVPTTCISQQNCSAVCVPITMGVLTQASMSKTNIQSSTDVTASNTQPLVSPGPPTLSPQIANQQKQLHQHQDTFVQRQLEFQTRPSLPTTTTTTNNPGTIIKPSGITVTSGAVIRSVPPKMVGGDRGNKFFYQNRQGQVRPNVITQQPLPLELLPQQPINVPQQMQQKQQQAAAFAQQQQQQMLPKQQPMPNTSTQQQHQPMPNVTQSQPTQVTSQPQTQNQSQQARTSQKSASVNQPHPPTTTIGQSQIQRHSYNQQNHPTSRPQGYGTIRNVASRPSNAPTVQPNKVLPTPSSNPSTPNLPPPNGILTSEAPPTPLPEVSLPQHPLPLQIAKQANEPVAQQQPATTKEPSVTVKTEKPRTIFSKSSATATAASPTTTPNPNTPSSSSSIPRKPSEPNASSSFRVDNESSPYAFEPEPSEVRPQFPYRASATSTPCKEKGQHDKKSVSTSTQESRPIHMSAFGMEGGPSIGSSIPIPNELATQLAEQVAAEGAPSGTETTYFIPLSTGTGQSFGVAVKLGTEGPPGPNQKVIMKAKLVTQPVGRTIGARVIGARTTTSSESTVELMSPVQPSLPKAESTPIPFNRMPIASPASNNSSSSSSDSSDSSSNSSGSSEDEDSRTKKRRKRLEKARGKNKRQKSPDFDKSTSKGQDSNLSKHSNTKIRDEKMSVGSPTPPGVSSAHSCLGPIEALEKFPKLGQHAHLVEAPVFRPTEKEFKDPMKYIERIRREAEPFGLCKIIPPSSFKPECNVDDDMRFTAYNQYIHRLMNRWGQNAKEMAAITKYLETQNVTIKPSNHPLVGGVEIDLPALYHAVQSFGGLTEVIQKKKWGRIADFLRVPKGTQDRGNKLDDVYCKFLLPYDTLSEVERNELLRLVEEEWEEKNKRKLEKSKNESGSKDSDDSDEDEENEESDDESGECVLKGKSTSLSQYFRVARNLMSMVFKNGEPDVNEVEEEYWRMVLERDVHMQVQQGSIDTGAGRGGEEFGFPTTRGSSCGRHPWNLKILSNNARSLLRCMGPVMGVTVPTLHVGMLFSTGCWYRDPHGLPWIEYHHTGAPKLWYGVPESHGIAFYTAMKQLVPTFCRKKPIWLPSDTAMVPPNLLVKYNVSCCRSVQEQGQFIVVFPRAYSSSICTGYSVSESVYFALRDYLDVAEAEFKSINDTKEPMMFPLSKLLLCIAQDEQTKKETLKLVKPLLEKIRDNEYVKRTMISDMGVKTTERINLKSDKKNQVEEDEYECEACSCNLYISFLCDVKEDTYYCHEHAIEYLQKLKQGQRRHCKLYYTHGKEEITAIIKMVNQRLEESDDSSSSSSDEIAIQRVSELQHQQQMAQLHQEAKNALQRPTTKPLVSPGTSSISSYSSVPHTKAKPTATKPKKEVKTKKEVEKKRKNSSEKDETDEDTDDEEEEEKKPVSKKKKIVEKKNEGKATKGNKKEKETKKKSKKSEKPSTSKDGAGKGKKESSSRVSVPARRKTKVRKATLDKAGNLASEILDMLLSTSNESSGEEERDEDSSDESWK